LEVFISLRSLAGLLLWALVPAPVQPATPPQRSGVTILYDAFGDRPGLSRDWGFAALVEYGGKRVLFDTGNNAHVFARNARALHVDLRSIDFVVVSHRHGDHTAGLNYLLQINPKVKIYVPKEGFGVFGAALPGSFFRTDSALPVRMRYFAGVPPEELRFGTAWPGANFTWVEGQTEVAPGFFLVSTVSKTPGTLELHELSLVIRTPRGLVVLVGCSHPGIQTILEATRGVGEHVHLIMGGLHLVNTPDPEIQRVVGSLDHDWQVDLIAPGHCTGEPAFAALQRAFGRRYRYAGLGTFVDLEEPE